jgi:hypothetical protein
MGQRRASVGKQQHDVARRGLRLAKGKPQADTINLFPALAALQAVPGPRHAEPPFFRSTFESCEREILRPSRRAIPPARRDKVQFRRSSTGADRSGTATLSAASAFTGEGPGAIRALRASTPPREKSLRQSRTLSCRTPKACAIRALVQPLSVSSSARARSASARSGPRDKTLNAAFCSCVAVTGDSPAMPSLRETTKKLNHSRNPLASPREYA